MKMFIAVFAAILCAAAVLFGVKSYTDGQARQKDRMARIAAESLDQIDRATKLIGPETEEKHVKMIRDTVAAAVSLADSAGFPEEYRKDVKDAARSKAAKAQEELIKRHRPDLAKLLDGV